MINNIKNNITKKPIKLNFLSGLLSILLIALILTIFEICYFYFIQIKQINEFIDYFNYTIKKSLNKTLDKYSDIKDSEYCNYINKYVPIKSQYSLFYGYNLMNSKNNNHIKTTVISIFILFILLILLLLSCMNTQSIKMNQTLKDSINYSFILSTVITIIIIIGFQFFFRLRIVDKYEFINLFDLDKLLYTSLK